MPKENEAERAAKTERERCLKIIDRFRENLGRMYQPIRNRIANPDYNPGAPDFEEDRFPGM